MCLFLIQHQMLDRISSTKSKRGRKWVREKERKREKDRGQFRCQKRKNTHISIEYPHLTRLFGLVFAPIEVMEQERERERIQRHTNTRWALHEYVSEFLAHKYHISDFYVFSIEILCGERQRTNHGLYQKKKHIFMNRKRMYLCVSESRTHTHEHKSTSTRAVEGETESEISHDLKANIRSTFQKHSQSQTTRCYCLCSSPHRLNVQTFSINTFLLPHSTYRHWIQGSFNRRICAHSISLNIFNSHGIFPNFTAATITIATGCFYCYLLLIHIWVQSTYWTQQCRIYSFFLLHFLPKVCFVHYTKSVLLSCSSNLFIQQNHANRQPRYVVYVFRSNRTSFDPEISIENYSPFDRISSSPTKWSAEFKHLLLWNQWHEIQYY